MKFADLNASTLKPKEVLKLIQANIDGSRMQIKWTEAFAAWARSMYIEFLPKNGVVLMEKHLPRLLKFLAEEYPEVLQMGTVIAKNEMGLGWTTFKLEAKEGITFPFSSDKTCYHTEKLSRMYEQEPKETKEYHEGFIARCEAYKLQVEADVKAYNKAAKKVAEAQQLLKTIKLPHSFGQLSRTFGLLEEIQTRY